MSDSAQYVVAAEVATNYKGCIVAPEGAMIVATHTVVYGPDTKENCEKWKNQNCSG